MFRQLIGLVLLSLAAFGISPAQADTVYLYEGPPVIEMEQLQTSGGASRADTLQPTFSEPTDRTMYDLNLEVLTNGDLDNIDVISACFFTSSVATTASERDNLCGYADGTPTEAPTNPSPAHAISMAWSDDTFRIDGSNDHILGTPTHTTDETDRSVSGSSVTFRVHQLTFQFALSHAAINTSDWTVRVVAVSTPTSDDGEEVTPQRTELLMDTNCSGSYVNQLADAGCGTLDEYGVNFIGGFKSGTQRPSVDYGQVNENSSSATEESIRTGFYYANDSADLTIAASDFTNGNDTISLVTDSIDAVQNSKAIALNCIGGVGSVLLGAGVQDFYTSKETSSTNLDPEAPREAPEHDCMLHYGVGASFANDDYTNTVEIGIKDADTGTGPSTSAIEVVPSP